MERYFESNVKYMGLSTEDKPVDVVNGAIFIETDTECEFIFNSEKWELKDQKTYEWLDIQIESGSFFSADIDVGMFDLATGLFIGDGNGQISFRVTDPSGTFYAWDPLGNMNSATLHSSCQASVTGLEKVKLIVQNSTDEVVKSNIYVFLGRSGK